jgi:Cupin
VDYSARLGVRTYGGRAEGEAMVVSGTYQPSGDVSRRLLTALPSVFVVPAALVAGSVMEMVLGETRGEAVGGMVETDELSGALGGEATVACGSIRPRLEALPGGSSSSRPCRVVAAVQDEGEPLVEPGHGTREPTP